MSSIKTGCHRARLHLTGFCFSLSFAYACLQNAKRCNIDVPRNLKIIGYDGNDIMQLSYPKVTTVRQDVGKIARTCIEVVQERIAGKRVENVYFIPVLVEKGGTTK